MEINCEDQKAWKMFIDEQGDIYVYSRCDCGKFLSVGEVSTNGNGAVKLDKWMCAKHGEKQPHYERL